MAAAGWITGRRSPSRAGRTQWGPRRAGSPFLSTVPAASPEAGCSSDQVSILRVEPGWVGDNERVAVPCADSVASTRNSNSLFACRWLRARV